MQRSVSEKEENHLHKLRNSEAGNRLENIKIFICTISLRLGVVFYRMIVYIYTL